METKREQDSDHQGTRHRRFTLGSKVDVIVSAVDRFRRQMDFALAE